MGQGPHLQHIYNAMVNSKRVGRVDVSDPAPKKGANQA